MSKRMIRGRNRMPDQWEWSCDYCGKTSLTNSQSTRPPGWVPKGRTAGHSRDFCSPEHEAAFNNRDKEQPAETGESPSEPTAEPAEPKAEAPAGAEAQASTE
ncbi:MAG: hypothetical protein ACJ78Q_02485 [Chloroflexia bacterium]